MKLILTVVIFIAFKLFEIMYNPLKWIATAFIITFKSVKEINDKEIKTIISQVLVWTIGTFILGYVSIYTCYIFQWIPFNETIFSLKDPYAVLLILIFGCIAEFIGYILWGVGAVFYLIYQEYVDILIDWVKENWKKAKSITGYKK